MAAVVGRTAYDSLGARNAVLIHRADVAGRGWARSFERVFDERGGRVTYRLAQLDSATDWETYAALIVRVHPNVIAFAG
jgi:ABC-type branched-subunit amino acid transport system substrate-binding protein